LGLLLLAVILLVVAGRAIGGYSGEFNSSLIPGGRQSDSEPERCYRQPITGAKVSLKT
jgi:hypothetical protein